MKSKVLLIDDSVTIHRVIDLSIDIDRYDIVKVFSKEDAALKMQSEQYDYILLDNKLDNIIISEYIKELKSVQQSASVILLVGAFDRFDESDLEKTGADDYLVKPFDSQSLNEKLSSDADMMPAGIVEKIAEADFARDNDDYITPTASLTTGEVIDSLSKKEYLENLEEEQPDDLTDNGYVEDLDTAPSLEFDKMPKEAEETQQEENIQVEEQVEAANITAEDNIVEESQEDITAAENNEEEPVNISLDDTVSETVSLDEPAVTESTVEPALEVEQESETAEEKLNLAENEESLDMPAVEENNADEEISVQSAEDAAEEAAVDEPELEEVREETPLSAEVQEEENASVDTEEIEIPDNITAVHNPVLSDIDSDADISDEYVMQDNLEEVDPISQKDMLDEFPDFPDVEDVSTDEMQEEEQTDHQDETPAEQENKALLVDDDDWLSDAPAAHEENNADMQAEEPLELLEESLAASEDTAEENISASDDDVQEESDAAEIPVEEAPAEEAVEHFDIPAEEPVQSEEIQENSQEETSVETAEETVTPAEDELPDVPSLEEVSAVEETVYTADENPVENTDEPLIEENMEETAEEVTEDAPAEETSFDMAEAKSEDMAVSEEPVIEETILPVEKEEVQQEPANINQAEESSSETTGRFGGITVTISRDEIIAMLGNAIDKHFLEESIKEIIASNMKEIVRNIVPAIAEKYIKEEIERLKSDE